MKIVKSYPPNYGEIAERFNIRGMRGILFAWGNTIFNPDGTNVEEHHVVHESVHQKQQEKWGSIEGWWYKYIHDKYFRFDQEVEAYATQYNYLEKVCSKKELLRMLKLMAGDLSGPMYGMKIAPREAADFIVRTARKSFPQV